MNEFVQGSIHIWRQMSWVIFDLPTYPNQISSDVAWPTYLPLDLTSDFEKFTSPVKNVYIIWTSFYSLCNSQLNTISYDFSQKCEFFNLGQLVIKLMHLSSITTLWFMMPITLVSKNIISKGTCKFTFAFTHCEPMTFWTLYFSILFSILCNFVFPLKKVSKFKK
jgi:hypothetical protein